MRISTSSQASNQNNSHTYGDASTDIKQMADVLRKLRPFNFVAGRKHTAFPTISNSPLNNVDIPSLHTWLTSKKKAIANNPLLCHEPDNEGETEHELEEEEENIEDAEEDL